MGLEAAPKALLALLPPVSSQSGLGVDLEPRPEWMAPTQLIDASSCCWGRLNMACAAPAPADRRGSSQ